MSSNSFDKISFRSAAVLVFTAVATGVSAHAQLEQSIPAVGGIVNGSPTELTLRFSEGIEPQFSSVVISTEAGGTVAAGPVSVVPEGGSTLTVRIRQPLRPGTYVVSWRATSVDSHKTQGSYRFTVEP